MRACAGRMLRAPTVFEERRQYDLNVTARGLAAIGATLSDAGVNPLTGERLWTQTPAVTRLP
jgi:glutaminase